MEKVYGPVRDRKEFKLWNVYNGKKEEQNVANIGYITGETENSNMVLLEMVKSQ